jgi:hypothetical protein
MCRGPVYGPLDRWHNQTTPPAVQLLERSCVAGVGICLYLTATTEKVRDHVGCVLFRDDHFRPHHGFQEYRRGLFCRIRWVVDRVRLRNCVA